MITMTRIALLLLFRDDGPRSLLRQHLRSDQATNEHAVDRQSPHFFSEAPRAWPRLARLSNDFNVLLCHAVAGVESFCCADFTYRFADAARAAAQAARAR
jgi:hypothetical protein